MSVPIDTLCLVTALALSLVSRVGDRAHAVSCDSEPEKMSVVIAVQPTHETAAPFRPNPRHLIPTGDQCAGHQIVTGGSVIT